MKGERERQSAARSALTENRCRREDAAAVLVGKRRAMLTLMGEARKAGIPVTEIADLVGIHRVEAYSLFSNPRLPRLLEAVEEDS